MLPHLNFPDGKMNVTAKPPNALKSGNWYYGWRCKSCDKQFAVFDDPTAGKAPIPSYGNAVIAVRCPLCKEMNEASVEAMVHFKA